MAKCRISMKITDILGDMKIIDGIPVLVSRDNCFALVREDYVLDLIDKYNMEPVDISKAALKHEYDTLWLCIDNESCYDIEILHRLCADLSTVYISEKKFIMFESKALWGWRILLSPYCSW